RQNPHGSSINGQTPFLPGRRPAETVSTLRRRPSSGRPPSACRRSAWLGQEGGPAVGGPEEVHEVLPGLRAVGILGVGPAEQAQIAPDLEQVVPESVEVEHLGEDDRAAGGGEG